MKKRAICNLPQREPSRSQIFDLHTVDSRHAPINRFQEEAPSQWFVSSLTPVASSALRFV